MSEENVQTPGIKHPVKAIFPWLFVCLFWLICGILTFAVLMLKTHAGWFNPIKKDVDTHYALKMLNFNMPNSYNELIDALHNNQPIPDNYTAYYQIAAEFMPQDFASHYLLGLCRQSQNALDQSVASYQHAIELNPYFFWSYYNLGLLYWQKGNLKAAKRLWSTALQLPPQLTLQSLSTTKLMADFVNQTTSSGYNPNQSLKTGYEQALTWVKGEDSPKQSHPTAF